MERLLAYALDGMDYELRDAWHLGAGLRDSRILFAVCVDCYGFGEELCSLLRLLRSRADCLSGCVGGILVDGEGELYTKQAAQEIAFSANLAGCTFPGKPLVEGTGSLYNQHILAAKLELDWESTYFRRARELCARIAGFTPPRFRKPRLLMIHASDNRKSNTVWIGRQVLARLPEDYSVREVSLQNGTIYDCRGCSYKACLHFAEEGTCFYGGAISEEIQPAIRDCDAMLFLCPNYNDAVSANIMALFNRLTNLLLRQELYDKYLFGIVVSGYSGSDLVARQLLGAMCFNKTAILAPRFCLLQTAHDPGSAREAGGIGEHISAFASGIDSTLRGA